MKANEASIGMLRAINYIFAALADSYIRRAKFFQINSS